MLKLPSRWISLWQAAWSWQSRVDTARSQWAVTGRWIEALLEPRWCPARRGRGSAHGAFPSHLCLSLEPPAARPADSAIDNPLVPHERRRPGGGAPLDDPSCTDSACCLSFSTVVRFCSMFAACLLTREADTRCSRQSLQADGFFHEFAGSGSGTAGAGFLQPLQLMLKYVAHQRPSHSASKLFQSSAARPADALLPGERSTRSAVVRVLTPGTRSWRLSVSSGC